VINDIIELNLPVWESIVMLWGQPLVPFLFVLASAGIWQIPLLVSQLHGIATGATAYEKIEENRKRKEHNDRKSFEAKKKAGLKQNVVNFFFHRNEVKYTLTT